jgi:O-antigen/teichoic acid export membrane protein
MRAAGPLACAPEPAENAGARRPLSLRRNFSWSLVSNVVYAGCQWGMLLVITRLGSPEMLGQFALALAVTTPVLAFGNLKTRGVQASDARREYHFREYFWLAVDMTALALLVIAGIVLAAGYRPETGQVILIVALGKAFDVLADVFFGRYQQIEEMDRIARALIANGVLSLAALAAGIYLTGSIVWGAAGWALAKGLILVAYNFRGAGPLFRDDGPPPSPGWPSARLAALAWLTLPLCFAALLLSLNVNVPRYFIERYLGERELGLFAAMAFLLLPGTSILVAALGQAASPRLARHYAAGDARAFLALLLRLLAVGGLAGGLALLVVLVAGRGILALLYTPEYAEHAGLFVWLTLEAALSFLPAILVYGMTAARHFRAQFLLTLAALAVTIVGCAVLVPGYGLFGAVLATILAGLFQLAGSAFIITRALRQLRAEGPPRSRGRCRPGPGNDI